MTRRHRLALGSVLCAALACAEVQRIPADQRVELEVLALQTACSELPPNLGSPDVQAVCKAFGPREQGDDQHSGDGGPATGLEDAGPQ